MDEGFANNKEIEDVCTEMYSVRKELKILKEKESDLVAKIYELLQGVYGEYKIKDGMTLKMAVTENEKVSKDIEGFLADYPQFRMCFNASYKVNKKAWNTIPTADKEELGKFVEINFGKPKVTIKEWEKDNKNKE